MRSFRLQRGSDKEETPEQPAAAPVMPAEPAPPTPTPDDSGPAAAPTQPIGEQPAPVESAAPPSAAPLAPSSPVATTPAPPAQSLSSVVETPAPAVPGAEAPAAGAAIGPPWVPPADESTRARRKRERAEKKLTRANQRAAERLEREQAVVARREAKGAAKGEVAPADPAVAEVPAAPTAPELATPTNPFAPTPGTPPSVPEPAAPADPVSEAALAGAADAPSNSGLAAQSSLAQKISGEVSIREQAERDAMRRFDREDDTSNPDERISAEAERRIDDARRQSSETEPSPSYVASTKPPPEAEADVEAETAAVPPEVDSIEPELPAAEQEPVASSESDMAPSMPTPGLFAPTELKPNPFMSSPVGESQAAEPDAAPTPEPGAIDVDATPEPFMPEAETQAAPEPPNEVPFPPVSSTFDRSAAPPPDPARSKLLAELRQAELQLDRRRLQEDELANELKATEDRLAQSQERTAEALTRAAKRLQEIEARAAEAEARAARAERLSRLKAEEVDRAERLRELLDRIADAEQRASDAEGRARDTVVQIGDPLAEIDPDSIFETKPGHIPVLDDSLADDEPLSEAPDSDYDLPSVADADLDVAEDPAAPNPRAYGDPTGAALDQLERSEIDADAAAEAEEPSPAPTVGSNDGPPSSNGAAVNINTASYEDLRGAGLSVTQTGRMLAFRERAGRFNSVDELEDVPGFPKEFLTEVKARLTV